MCVCVCVQGYANVKIIELGRRFIKLPSVNIKIFPKNKQIDLLCQEPISPLPGP